MAYRCSCHEIYNFFKQLAGMGPCGIKSYSPGTVRNILTRAGQVSMYVLCNGSPTRGPPACIYAASGHVFKLCTYRKNYRQ